MKEKIGIISVYSISHFVVDFVCAIFMLGFLPRVVQTNEEFVIALIIYNFFAFAFQVPLGFILDKLKIYKYVAIIGLSLIGLCYVIGSGNPFLLATIVGIGNALFHLEGGVNIYSISERKAFLNGVFVAPGALGIFLGTTFHDELIVTYLPIVLIFISIILLISVQRKNVIEGLKKNIKTDIKKSSVFLIIALIGISIIVRSIGGSAIVYTWKEGFILGLIYTISIVIGKAFGGLIADKFGLLRVALVSLLGAAICLVLGYNIPAFAYIGIFLFNIPMSITLTLLANTLSKKIACAIGLNTFFLFIGYLICFIDFAINNVFLLVGSILIAMLSIYLAYKLYIKGGIKLKK